MLRSLISSHKLFLPISAIVLIIFIAFFPSLKNGFVNWDDDAHLLKNPFIRSLNIEGIQDIFTTQVNKTYIPLTSLSFAIERHFFKENPLVYHVNNLLLHILVSILVFLFAINIGLTLGVSFIASVLFGLHPMHVESVAWVTERKDVLYAFFYMLSLLTYCKYVDIDKKRYSNIYLEPMKDDALNQDHGKKGVIKYLSLSLIFALLSVLSKPMALSLPLVLFLCDWFLKRKMTLFTLLEKVIFLGLIFPATWVTYSMQMRAVDLKFPNSILIWVWGFSFYLKKFLVPDFFVLFYRLPCIS